MSWYSYLKFGLSCLLLLASATHAQAELIGARVGMSTISPCPSFCGGSGGMSEFAFDGGGGLTSAATSLSNGDGSAEGFVNLSGQLFLPVLGSQAFSNANSRAGASATGLNSYDYEGATSTSITLDFVFDGIASAPDVDDASAVASIVVMKGSDFPFSTDYGTLVFEELEFGGSASLVGTERLFLEVNAGQQSLDGSVSIDLDPGDRIAVWGQVSTSGTRGGSADALNTLTSTFSSTTGITPTIVPSPTSGVLLSAALATLGLIGRRKRTIG